MDRVARDGRMVRVWASVIAAAATLAGCAQVRSGAQDLVEATHIAPLPIDPSSPVAADVGRAEQGVGPVPTFASMPPKPTDIRPADAYKQNVVAIVGDRRELTRWEAAHPPLVSDTDAFAVAQRAKLAGETPVTPEKEAESAAFARKLREAAQAPSQKPPQ
jgi:hypothetical protein